MKPKRTATFLLIGAILGTWGTLTLSAVSEETTTTATIYSTTGAETYSTFCPFMVTPGIEIKYSDYKAMIEKCEKLEYHKSENRIF